AAPWRVQKLPGVRRFGTEPDAVDSLDLEEVCRELAAAVRRRQLRPALVASKVDVRHSVSRLAHDGLWEPLRDQGKCDRRALPRLDDPAEIEVRVCIRQYM